MQTELLKNITKMAYEEDADHDLFVIIRDLITYISELQRELIITKVDPEQQSELRDALFQESLLDAKEFYAKLAKQVEFLCPWNGNEDGVRVKTTHSIFHTGLDFQEDYCPFDRAAKRVSEILKY